MIIILELDSKTCYSRIYYRIIYSISVNGIIYYTRDDGLRFEKNFALREKLLRLNLY